MTTAQSSTPAITLMFPGLGDQYVNMGVDLHRHEPVFCESLDRCADLLLPELGLDIRTIIYPPTASKTHSEGVPAAKQGIDLRKMLGRDRQEPTAADVRLSATRLAQPALFVVEYALARLWQRDGLRIDSMLGYSLGEYVAACLAGVLSLEDSLKLVARRAALIEELPHGAMLAVALSEHATTPLLGEHLSISAINGSELTVVAGPPEAIEALEKRLAHTGTTSRRVVSMHAFHSKMMEPIASRLTQLMAHFKLAPPSIPYISNVTGTFVTREQATDPQYFATHLCRPVRFADGLAELMKTPERIFVESGPGQTLSSLAIAHPRAPSAKPPVVIASMRHAFEVQADTVVLDKARERLRAAGAMTRDTTGAIKTAAADVFFPPETDTEKELATIWQKVLSVPSVGKTDHFFALGGNSLVATRLLFRIFKSFRVNLPLRRVYEAPALVDLARAIDAMCEGKENADPRNSNTGDVKSDANVALLRYRLQNGMEIFHQNEGETKHFYEDIFAHRSYMKHGMRIPAGGTVFDVGGNIGLFTLFASTEAPDARIYTFEPAPPLFEILRRNVEHFHVKAEIFNIGLSNRECDAPFTFYPQSSGMSSFYADKAEERHVLSTIIENQRKIGMVETDQVLQHANELFDVRLREIPFTAQLRRVSDIIREKEVQRVDLMKVDVQKAELEVLEGIDDGDWSKFAQIVLEVHDTDGRAKHVAKLLEGRGFSVFVEQDELYVGTNIHNIYARRTDMTARVGEGIE